MKLNRQIRELLLENNWTLATAESCTGGLLAHTITNSAGSSNYFSYGYITYSDEAKIKELNIPREIIGKFSSYSGEVAELMAKNVREKTGSTFGVSVTGIAPPGDSSTDLSVGTVFIGISSVENTIHFVFQVNKHSRTRFKKQVTKFAIKAFSKQISNQK